ncbi:hypothetical protein [Synechocystis sp. PCC 6714]|uniref:hypothetical protein n=1 Tax=Synechocystis sp. (strain PCC 6714) TaxID=1147 RepID=UPI0004D0EEAE|nr:hypothetical protein [Synechocystis sp. PCC 6714]AIE76243.1 hypothetical protein D082_50810 [Synechocystis sp. PCC 6714]
MIKQAIQLAQLFGNLLTQTDYTSAYALLSPELQQQYSPQTLRKTVEAMIDYGSGPIRSAIVMVDCLLTEWQYPAMEANDVVWLYVSLEGEDFIEAVSLIVQHWEGKLVIRWLEWGRP